MKPHNFAPYTQDILESSNTSLSSSFGQLHHQPRLSEQYLAATFLGGEESIDEEDKEEPDISLEPQLDLTADQVAPDEDPLDILTETLWNQAKEKDKFAPLILKLLKDGA